MNILFVCTGNTCRSPMAEALLREKHPSVSVQSAGVFAANGAPASMHAVQALQEKNIQLNHQSQPVTDELLHWADLVLTMTNHHKYLLHTEYPSHRHKVYTLKEYVNAPDTEKIKRLQAKIEDKRRQFIAEHPELGPDELEEKLKEHVKDDTKKLDQWTMSNLDYDISDPFGGDLELYRATRAELEMNIDRLIQKIDASKGE